MNSFTAIMLNSFEYAKKKSELGARGAKALIDQISHIRMKKKSLSGLRKSLANKLINKNQKKLTNFTTEISHTK